MKVSLVIIDYWPSDHAGMRMVYQAGQPAQSTPIPADVARPICEGGSHVVEVTAATPTSTIVTLGAADDLRDAQHVAEGAMVRAAAERLGLVAVEWPVARIQEAWDYRVRLGQQLALARAA